MIKKYKTEIAIVVGNRPQFIKLMPVYRELIKYKTPYIIHTGQHYDENMSDIFFDDFDLPVPDINLEISGGSHGEFTGKLIIRLEEELKKISPEKLLLFGDTNSTLAAAIAAVKLHINIFHIESGARIFDKFQSPEEANRLITERVSTLLFPPTENCLKNLINDGRGKDSHFFGDVMFDTFRIMKEKIEKSQILSDFDLKYGEYILLTLHRPINVDKYDILEKIVKFLINIEKKIIFLIHPRTRNKLEEFNLLKELEKSENIILTAPKGYIDTQNLIMNSSMVITDSGGIQKETYFSKKRVLLLYPYTPWPEIEKINFLKKIDPANDELKNEIINWKEGEYLPLFGDGNSSEKIVNSIIN